MYGWGLHYTNWKEEKVKDPEEKSKRYDGGSKMKSREQHLTWFTPSL